MTVLFDNIKHVNLHPRASVGWKAVSSDDDLELTSLELASFGKSVRKLRQQGGAARSIARKLIFDRSHMYCELPRRFGHPPYWPNGLTGSLSHCDSAAAAAIASKADFMAIGVDIEPAEPLDEAELSVIARIEERDFLSAGSLATRILFCVKEAAYKAAFSLDGLFLEPCEMFVHPDFSSAKTSYGRHVSVVYQCFDYVVALAYIENA